MRVSIYLATLTAALVAAIPNPHAQDEPAFSISASIATPTVAVPLSTSLNVPVTVSSTAPTGLPGVELTSTSSRHRKSHWEPVPIFSKECDCAALSTVAYPCWATDSLQRCNFEELHSFVCWTSANYGCPSPTRTCDNLFTATPLTRNPCELGPNTGIDPAITDAARILGVKL